MTCLHAMRFRTMASLAFCMVFAATTSVWSCKTMGDDFPSYPLEPTVIAYEVEPGWRQRPEDLGPVAAVAGVEVDREDQVWCVERTTVPVQVYAPDGKLVRAWGQEHLEGPHTLRFDSQGNVWVSDFKLHVIRKFTPEGKLLMTIGTPGESGDDESHFFRPTDMAITPAGDIFVSDGYGNRRVVHFDAEGKFVKAWGEFGSKPGQFILPHMIVADSRGTLFVADRNSGRVELFDQSGKLLDQWSNIMMPWGLWISPKDELWICGTSPQLWRKDGEFPPPKDQVFMRFSTNGRVEQVWTVPKGKDGEEQPGDCNWLHCMALDSKGNIYAGDIMGKRLQKFVPASE